MTAMRGSWVLAAIAALAAGAAACGNGNSKEKATATGQAATTPPPAPSCEEMAAKTIKPLAKIARERCEADGWSAEIRRCMADAGSGDEARGCFEKLPPAQQEAMERAERERANEADSAAAPPPPPPAAAKTAAPLAVPPPAPEAAKDKKAPSPRKAKGAAKPSSQTTDPDEGGE